MENTELNKKTSNAIKWSSITEIVARLVVPITSMLLARVLTPEAFGVVTTLTMIISFVEIFADAGFQKYIIQHQFIDEKDLEQSTTVAFWSNFFISILLWTLIAIFADSLANMVGNPGLGNVLIVACVSIPLQAFSSIQMALYKRNLDFKTLFKVRMVGIAVPMIITIPLAIYFRNYWALIIGTICTNLLNAVLLTYFSSWKPRLYYSFDKFKVMFSFTMWSMIEAVSIWLTGYMDIFIIGLYLNSYYIGVYKTSMIVVGQIMGLITSATTPILFSSLSRLQNSNVEFENMFFKFQKIVGLFVIPLGVGIYCYRILVTEILLGEQWLEASNFIGLWGFTSALTIVFSHYSSEIYPSKGIPKLSVLSQFLHIIVLLPIVWITVKYSFEVLCFSRAFVRFEGIIINLIFIQFIFKISIIKMIRNITPALCSACVMFVISLCCQKYFNDNISWEIISIIICMITYFTFICLFKEERHLILDRCKTLYRRVL